MDAHTHTHPHTHVHREQANKQSANERTNCRMDGCWWCGGCAFSTQAHRYTRTHTHSQLQITTGRSECSNRMNVETKTTHNTLALTSHPPVRLLSVCPTVSPQMPGGRSFGLVLCVHTQTHTLPVYRSESSRVNRLRRRRTTISCVNATKCGNEIQQKPKLMNVRRSKAKNNKNENNNNNSKYRFLLLY